MKHEKHYGDNLMEDNRREISLAEAIASLRDMNEANRFLADICTPAEIKALSERWRVCQLLHNTDLSYRQIHTRTGASLTTIGRVARFLREENNGGYTKILDKFKSK